MISKAHLPHNRSGSSELQCACAVEIVSANPSTPCVNHSSAHHHQVNGHLPQHTIITATAHAFIRSVIRTAPSSWNLEWYLPWRIKVAFWSGGENAHLLHVFSHIRSINSIHVYALKYYEAYTIGGLVVFIIHRNKNCHGRSLHPSFI